MERRAGDGQGGVRRSGEGTSSFSPRAHAAEAVTRVSLSSHVSPGSAPFTKTARPPTRQTPEPSEDQPSIGAVKRSFLTNRRS